MVWKEGCTTTAVYTSDYGYNWYNQKKETTIWSNYPSHIYNIIKTWTFISHPSHPIPSHSIPSLPIPNQLEHSSVKKRNVHLWRVRSTLYSHRAEHYFLHCPHLVPAHKPPTLFPRSVAGTRLLVITHPHWQHRQTRSPPSIHKTKFSSYCYYLLLCHRTSQGRAGSGIPSWTPHFLMSQHQQQQQQQQWGKKPDDESH